MQTQRVIALCQPCQSAGIASTAGLAFNAMQCMLGVSHTGRLSCAHGGVAGVTREVVFCNNQWVPIWVVSNPTSLDRNPPGSDTQSSKAMALAEKYGDMVTLTYLVVADSQYYLDYNTANADEQRAITEHLEDLLTRTGRYFQKFGDDWANAFFDEAFSGGRAGSMLEEAQQNWGSALTRYLRANDTRAEDWSGLLVRLSTMFDVGVSDGELA